MQISTFVVRYLDSIIPILATLVSAAESYLVENPEDRFSHVEAHIMVVRCGLKFRHEGSCSASMRLMP